MIRRCWLPILFLLFSAPLGVFADVRVSATVDRKAIDQDESVALRFSVVKDSVGLLSATPSYDAPEFDLVNQFQSTSVNSVYENGQIQVRTEYQVTHVLRPIKTGKISIRNIQVVADGKTYHLPEIVIEVGAAGAGTPPPRSYQGGLGSLRGQSDTNRRVGGREFFVRAEVNKSQVYKGEQIIVSYYLYRRVPIFNIQVTKYPTLNGFLREDLEMPILGQRLDSEAVVVQGAAYQRSLLARYAAYPLKTGELKIDPLEIKANYYRPGRGGGGAAGRFGDDDWDPFSNFFQRMNPQSGKQRSEIVRLKVKDLPESGRPADFKGVVGDYQIVGAVDRYRLNAGETLTLTVKVEGRGNVNAIEAPKAEWPKGLELYESKGRTKAGQGGVGQKIFEYLFIPRIPGEVTLPALKIHFFDPDREAYRVVSTDPIRIEVGAPTGDVSSVVQDAGTEEKAGESDTKDAPLEDIEGLKPMGEARAEGDLGRWLGAVARVLFLIGGTLLLGLLVWAGVGFLRRSADRRSRERKESGETELSQLRSAVGRLSRQGTPTEIVEFYQSVERWLLSALEARLGLSVRSYARHELEDALVRQKGVALELWRAAARVLEKAETLRYSKGVVSEAEFRSQLAEDLRAAERLVAGIPGVTNRS